jgi:hypothetical protein
MATYVKLGSRVKWVQNRVHEPSSAGIKVHGFKNPLFRGVLTLNEPTCYHDTDTADTAAAGRGGV